MPNYYEILGIPRSANNVQIRQAFRKLARQYHPDVNQGNADAEETFKLINEANSVLAEPDSRRKYDRYGDNWSRADDLDQAAAQARRSTRGPSNFSWTNTNSSNQEVGNIFDQLFRHMGPDARTRTIPEYPISLTLEEAFQGSTRIMELGADRRLEVKIPPGVDNSSKVHIPDRNPKMGGFNLLISVRPHSMFTRKGRDLFGSITIPMEDALLGTEVTVETLSGKVALTIPAETQNGRRFRMARQGMPELNRPSSRGDLFTTISVVLPTGMTEKQRELIRLFKESRISGDG